MISESFTTVLRIFFPVLAVILGLNISRGKIKKDYCKHTYEKHTEVDECIGKPFPWEVK